MHYYIVKIHVKSPLKSNNNYDSKSSKTLKLNNKEW